MTTISVFISVLSASLVAIYAGAATAQNYPNRPVRLVTTSPGGGNDLSARLLAQGLSESLNQQVIVDNRTSSVVPGDIVAKAPPDGYTLILGASTFFIGPLITKYPYDPVKDFSPIIHVARSPNVVVVHPAVPANSVSGLIAYAKSRPGQLNYGTTGVGSSAHLAGELFKSMAGIDIVHVPYKGSGPAAIALLAGQVEVAFSNPTAVTPHIKSGKLRALAVASLQPSPLVPGLPTVASTGLTGYESGSTYGVWAPAKTPTAVINLLNQESHRILNTPDVRNKLLSFGMEPVGGSPEQLGVTMKAEMTRFGKVIKDAGISAD